MQYKPIELDEAFDLYQIRKQAETAVYKKRSRLRFDKFCDMLKRGGYTIV